MANIDVSTPSGGASPTSWSTVLDFDWTAQGNANVGLPDGLKTIGGKQWRFKNLASLDSSQAVVSSGAGLLLPNNTTNANRFGTATDTAPGVFMHGVDAEPTYHPATHELRYWWRFTTNQAANFESPMVFAGTMNANTFASMLAKRYEGGSVYWAALMEVDGVGIYGGLGDTRNPTHDVVMVQVVSSCDQRWFTGAWASGWPTLSSLVPRRAMVPFSNDSDDSRQYWPRNDVLCGIFGVTANTAGNHQTVVTHTRVDIKEF